MLHCEACNVDFRGKEQFCPTCGARLRQAVEPISGTISLGASIPADARCPRCGAEAAPGKKFCRRCGSELSTLSTGPAKVENTANCPRCGGLLILGKKFCKNCGYDLQQLNQPTIISNEPQRGRTEPRVSTDGATALKLETVPVSAVQTAPASVAELVPEPAPATEPTRDVAPALAIAAVEPEAVRPPAERSTVPVPVTVEQASAPSTVLDSEAGEHNWRRLAWMTGGAVALTAVAIALWVGLFSSEARVLRLARGGSLVSPEGSSAYDVYLKMKPGGLSTGSREKMQRNILPILNAEGERFLLKRAEGTSFKESEIRQLTRIYEFAADLNPQDPRMQARRSYAQGMAALIGGKPSLALQSLQTSIRYDSSWSPAYNQLGKIYVKLNDHYHAKESYQRAVALDPQWVFPQLNLAGIYLHDREWDLAEAAYLQTASLDNTLATPWYFLGQVYEAKKQTPQALAAYNKAIQLAATRPSTAFKVDALQRRISRLSKY